MGSDEEGAETEHGSEIPKLPLYTLPSLKSTQQQQQHSTNLLTSPLHTSASASVSVPFKWEEHPGKPLPCLELALPSSSSSSSTTTIKSLELPPRLLNEIKFTKTPSPTTVLEGPYSYSNSAAVGKSFSFRFLRRRQGSFDGSLSFGGSRGSSPERGLLGTIVLSRSSSVSRKETNTNTNTKGLFGSWMKRGNFKGKNSDVHGGKFVFPGFLSDDGITGTDDGGEATVQVTKMGKKGKFLGLSSSSKSHFWASIYGAFKQVIPSPRRSTKWKKDAW